MSKSIVGIALILVGIGMLGFLAVEAVSVLWSKTPAEAITLLDNGANHTPIATTTMSDTITPTGSNSVGNAVVKSQGQEPYCL